MDTLCEMYKGTYTLTPSEQGPSKTVLTYDVTMVAKSAGQTAELDSLVSSTVVNEKLPHLQTVLLSLMHLTWAAPIQNMSPGWRGIEGFSHKTLLVFAFVLPVHPVCARDSQSSGAQQAIKTRQVVVWCLNISGAMPSLQWGEAKCRNAVSASDLHSRISKA